MFSVFGWICVRGVSGIFLIELVTVVVGLGGLGIWGVGTCKAGWKFMRDG